VLPVRNASRSDAGGEYCVFFMAQRTANNRRLNLRGQKANPVSEYSPKRICSCFPSKKSTQECSAGDFLSSFAEPLLLVPYAPFSEYKRALITVWRHAERF
jgi:hypothetical protein